MSFFNMYHKKLLQIVPTQKITKITYHKKYYQLYPHKKVQKVHNSPNVDKKVKTNIQFLHKISTLFLSVEIFLLVVGQILYSKRN